MEIIKFVPLTFGSDTKTYVRADTIVQLSEDGDKTYVYTSNSDVPIKVKESVGEILAKIEGTAWVQAPTERIEPGTDGYAYKMTISNGKEFEKQNCDDAVSRKEVFETFGELLGIWGTQALMEMPSATPTRKTGKWIDTEKTSINKRGQIIHEVICSECNSLSYFRSMGNKYIGANLCSNCGSRNEVENDNK